MDTCFSKKSTTIILLSFFVAVATFICALACTNIAFATSKDSSVKSQNQSTDHISVDLNAKKKTKLNGLVKLEGGIHFYEKGKKVKCAWKKVNKKTYYFDKRGNAAKGIKKLSGKVYMFNDSGSLYRSKSNKLVERGNHTYYLTKKGQVLTGWQLYKNKLYHFSSFGKMDKSKTIDNVELKDDGKAKSSAAAKTKILALKALNKIVKADASKSEKLKAAWKYVTSKNRFRYRAIYPNLKDKDWQYDTACFMLKNKMGNCYSFACAFAAMAQAIGYDPTLCLGRIHGSRDGAADGFTRHAWVKIGGRYYDPELKYSGSANVYGTGYYPLSHRNTTFHKF